MELECKKTEVLVVPKGHRMKEEVKVRVGNEEVVVSSKKVKYLGVWLDQSLTFAEHVDRTVEKTSRCLATLSRLMPNVGGPVSKKRQLLTNVVASILLYAAQI